MDKASKTNLPFIVFRAFFLLSLLPCAAFAVFDGDWTRKIEATALTRFMRHGVERADESFQPGVWLASESLKLGAWANFPLSDTRSHELALNAAYTHAFGDAGTTLTADVTHFHLRDARNGHPGHTAELTLALAQPAGPGRVIVSVTRDVKREADLGEIAYVGEWALRNWGAFLNYRFYVGSMSARDVLPNLPGAKIADAYTFHGVDLTLPYRIGGATVLTAGVHYAGTQGQRPFWSPINARVGGKIWATLGATYEF
ncbi:MAG: hypothetical protein C0518_10585 [Opitutus sp.]|nr:hypothetical protein [Opitutus sp.]